MSRWFEFFHATLGGASSEGLDLIPAGKADAARALGHYRFQHRSKTREAVEETFPRLLEVTGEHWGTFWEAFRSSAPSSPRSLDFYPAVFLEWFMTSDAPMAWKELARFEHVLDAYPWTHGALDDVPMPALQADSRLRLAPLDYFTFQTPVVEWYEGVESLPGAQEVLVWMNRDGVRFRAMAPWERAVLGRLADGVGAALEGAPDDPEAVSALFRWLGQSSLVRGVR